MSSAVVSTSAALGRPFLFDADSDAVGAPLLAAVARSGKVAVLPEDLKKPATKQSLVAQFVQSTINNQKSTILQASVIPASRLEIRPAPEIASSGIAAFDSLTGGLPRGCLTEICGPASSGRTSVMLAALAAATRRGEFCALLDASDALDPKSAATAGIDLDRFLWVRCGEDSPKRYSGREKTNSKNKSAEFRLNARDASEQRLEQVLCATDLLLESGGFSLIVLDLADLPPQSARRIPLTTWFRFRRAVEHKPTILLAIEQQPIAGSCSSLLLQLGTAERRKSAVHEPAPTHAHLLSGLEINIEKICSRLDRKPAHSVTFETKTAWAG
jgi:recombination protein RecA